MNIEEVTWVISSQPMLHGRRKTQKRWNAFSPLLSRMLPLHSSCKLSAQINWKCLSKVILELRTFDQKDRCFQWKMDHLQNVCGMLSQNVVEVGMRHVHTVADTYSSQNLVTFILRAYYIIWLVSAGLAHPVIFKVRIIFDSRRQPVVETSNVGTRTHF